MCSSDLYDQIVHDVAIQKLPVRFCIDRAGFVGADGATHAGSFDIAYLINLPNFILMAPSNGQELVKMLNTSNQIDQNPCAIRYPRGECENNINYDDEEILEIGKAKIIKKGSEVAILSYGAILSNVIAAVEQLKQKNIAPTVVDMRFAKPFDKKLVNNLVKDHKVMITIEEGAIGGFGSILVNYLHDEGLVEKYNLRLRSLFMTDKFIDHDSQQNMQKKSNLDADSIVNIIEKLTK